MSETQTDSSTAKTSDRPAAIDFLITDYGNYIGLEGLAFDDDQQIVLEIDGRDLIIEYAGEGSGILFQSIVHSQGDEAFPEAIHEIINVLNANTFRTGGGIVFLAAETGHILWMDRLNTENLTMEMFNEAVKAAADHSSTWTRLIAAALSPEEGQEPAAQEINPMIRI